MRNVTQIAQNARLTGGGEAGIPDRKSPLTGRARSFTVTPVHGSCVHTAPAGTVGGSPDQRATCCSAGLTVCRSADLWRANGRTST